VGNFEVDRLLTELTRHDGPEPGVVRLAARESIPHLSEDLFPDDRDLIRGNRQDDHVSSLQRWLGAVVHRARAPRKRLAAGRLAGCRDGWMCFGVGVVHAGGQMSKRWSYSGCSVRSAFLHNSIHSVPAMRGNRFTRGAVPVGELPPRVTAT